MKNNMKTTARLTVSVITAIILSICLCVTTYALYLTVKVENNSFQTGIVEINLNDGYPVINADKFEPGMTVVKDFFVENKSSDSVYYRIYMDKINGGLADVLEVEIRDPGESDDTSDDKILYAGKMAELTRDNIVKANELAVLKLNQKKDLQIWFHFPEEEGNDTQDLEFTFDMCAEAVQTRNNPEGLFD